MVGLVDTWVVGHLPGALHLAAVGVGATIFSFLFWAFGFLRMSTTGLIAQAHGVQDIDLIARTVIRATSLGLLIAAILLVFQTALFSATMVALNPPDSTQVVVWDYFSIRIWSAPAALFIYAVTGYLIGTAKAKLALVLQLVLNICNGVLNLVFVLGYGMGVAGIALGSLVAEYTAALLGAYMLVRGIGGTVLLKAITSKITWQVNRMKKLLSANGYIFARTLILLTALSLVTRHAASLGEAALAATQVLSTFLMLISLGLDSFAYAAEALAGAAFGRGSKAEFRFWAVRTTLWAGGVSLLYAAVFYLFGSQIISVLTDIPEVRAEAGQAIIVMAFLPIFAVWCYQFDGIFIGATAGAGMLISMAAAFVVFVTLLGPLTEMLQLTGLWICLTIFMFSRGVAQMVYYPRLERNLR
ncbi:MAG: MATE family efflux transporter [Kordiimonadaceae bacterium]|nr:MATE family efflux transporter [Kordiimonadaceae bacterium]